MKLILCVDVDNGMSFNDRRQSRDREVIKDIFRYVGDGRIIISEYSRILFDSDKGNVVVSDFEEEETNAVLYESNKNHKTDIFDITDEQVFFFIEKIEHLNKINLNKIDELILYRWDKKYPTDYSFIVDKDEFRLKNTLEFQGYSHEKINREVYVKNER